MDGVADVCCDVDDIAGVDGDVAGMFLRLMVFIVIWMVLLILVVTVCG